MASPRSYSPPQDLAHAVLVGVIIAVDHAALSALVLIRALGTLSATILPACSITSAETLNSAGAGYLAREIAR